MWRVREVHEEGSKKEKCNSNRNAWSPKKIKLHKAAGCNKITPEILKYMDLKERYYCFRSNKMHKKPRCLCQRIEQLELFFQYTRRVITKSVKINRDITLLLFSERLHYRILEIKLEPLNESATGVLTEYGTFTDALI